MRKCFEFDAIKNMKLKFENKKIKKSRRCNICADHFRPKTRFDRYCRHCREENELFKYGNWLPEMDDQLAVQFL